MNNTLFIKTRLSILMFLQVFVFGVTSPIMSLYLTKCLNFSSSQAGIILSVAGITTIISPIMGTFIADRLISAERLLIICHLFASAFILVFSFQTSFKSVLVAYLFYMLVLGCTSGIATAIVFNHETDAKKNFGGIRMWGTIGWIASAWLFSYIWLRGAEGATALMRLGATLKVSSCISLILAVYILTLPKSKVNLKEKKTLFPVEALSVMAKPQLILLSVLMFLSFVSFQFYSFGMAPFLQQSGYRASDIMPLMSVGQIAETIGLGFLGYFLLRKSYKTVLSLGMLLNLWPYIAFSLGASFPLILLGILSQGFCFALFFTGACIYFDSQCDPEARSGVQQIIGIIAYGFGTSLGNLSAGQTASFFQISQTAATGSVNYSMYWIVPLVIDAVVLLLLVVFFKEESSQKKESSRRKAVKEVQG